MSSASKETWKSRLNGLPADDSQRNCQPEADVMVLQVQQRAADVIGLEGAAHAALAPVRAEHEVLDHQLAAAFEQLAQANRAAGVVKAVVLGDAPPGQLPALLEECVALAGELLLLA